MRTGVSQRDRKEGSKGTKMDQDVFLVSFLGSARPDSLLLKSGLKSVAITGAQSRSMCSDPLPSMLNISRHKMQTVARYNAILVQ